jgi:hypothetical protein
MCHELWQHHPRCCDHKYLDRVALCGRPKCRTSGYWTHNTEHTVTVTGREAICEACQLELRLAAVQLAKEVSNERYFREGSPEEVQKGLESQHHSEGDEDVEIRGKEDWEAPRFRYPESGWKRAEAMAESERCDAMTDHQRDSADEGSRKRKRSDLCGGSRPLRRERISTWNR